jgi:hypothetical protein
MAQEPVGLISFGTRRVGKKYRRVVDVSRFYFSTSLAPKAEPVFEARVARDVVLNALEELRIPFIRRGDGIIEIYSDVDFKKVVVFSGVRQFLGNGVRARSWLELIGTMSDLEILFWYTKFLYLYEKVGYWGVYRVAKSIWTLYRL